MPKKHRKFADDGWAVWVDGDDTSTVYINDWINPRGKSYVDLAIRIRGILSSKGLYVSCRQLSVQPALWISRKTTALLKLHITEKQ